MYLCFSDVTQTENEENADNSNVPVDFVDTDASSYR